MACDWEETRNRYKALLLEKMQWCAQRRQLEERISRLLELSEKLFDAYMDNLESQMSGEDVDLIWRGWIASYPQLRKVWDEEKQDYVFCREAEDDTGRTCGQDDSQQLVSSHSEVGEE